MFLTSSYVIIKPDDQTIQRERSHREREVLQALPDTLVKFETAVKQRRLDRSAYTLLDHRSDRLLFQCHEDEPVTTNLYVPGGAAVLEPTALELERLQKLLDHTSARAIVPLYSCVGENNTFLKQVERFAEIATQYHPDLLYGQSFGGFLALHVYQALKIRSQHESIRGLMLWSPPTEPCEVLPHPTTPFARRLTAFMDFAATHQETPHLLSGIPELSIDPTVSSLILFGGNEVLRPSILQLVDRMRNQVASVNVVEFSHTDHGSHLHDSEQAPYVTGVIKVECEWLRQWKDSPSLAKEQTPGQRGLWHIYKLDDFLHTQLRLLPPLYYCSIPACRITKIREDFIQHHERRHLFDREREAAHFDPKHYTEAYFSILCRYLGINLPELPVKDKAAKLEEWYEERRETDVEKSYWMEQRMERLQTKGWDWVDNNERP